MFRQARCHQPTSFSNSDTSPVYNIRVECLEWNPFHVHRLDSLLLLAYVCFLRYLFVLFTIMGTSILKIASTI